MDTWRNDMRAEIDRINQDILTIPPEEKAAAINQWIDSAYRMPEGDKAKAQHGHRALLEEVSKPPLPLLTNGLPRDATDKGNILFGTLDVIEYH
eukprot:scaffold10361_cov76-Skeletonema_dohrnii-CCMP3373.AAC.1